LKYHRKAEIALPQRTHLNATREANLLTDARPPSKSEAQTMVQPSSTDRPARIIAPREMIPAAISDIREKKAGSFLYERISAAAAERNNRSGRIRKTYSIRITKTTFKLASGLSG